jgi:phosphomannomutase
MEDYLAFALASAGAPEAQQVRVVADAGNGVGGLLWDPLAAQLGLESVRMNFEPDGRFPSHHPDPSRGENLQPLVERVVADGADVGLCYDGDADRVVAVLSDGHVVDGSEMIVCIVESAFGQSGGACPLFGVAQSTCRKALDYFGARGVEPVMTPVGHAKIKRVMRATPEMVFAGEDAGHYYYRDFFCSDSALITTLHVLRLAAAGRLRDLVDALPGPWYRPGREPSFAFADQSAAVAVCRRVAAEALQQGPHTLEITCERDGHILRRRSPSDVADAEGIRVDYTDWWFCVRPSGTEPIARLSLEARREDLLAHQTARLSGLFERFQGTPPA